MSHDYTLISDLNSMNLRQPFPDPSQMGGMQMNGGNGNQGMPMNMSGPDQIAMLRTYLAESADDSDNDSDSDSGSDPESSGDGNWQHYYGIATLIMLAIILYYVFKIRNDLTGMYEEA